jgi:hypothetical protein
MPATAVSNGRRRAPREASRGNNYKEYLRSEYIKKKIVYIPILPKNPQERTTWLVDVSFLIPTPSSAFLRKLIDHP